MKPSLRIPLLMTAVLVGSLCGCAGSDHGETSSASGFALTPEGGPVGGTGYYLIENAYEAEFSNCTGKASVLEGLTFAEGYALAPICIASGSFDVIQNGTTLSVIPHPVNCSDGTSAMVSGVAVSEDGVLSGVWETSSTEGVMASQDFSGTMSSQSMQIKEVRRTFVGTFDGECTLSPPLSTTLTVI